MHYFILFYSISFYLFIQFFYLCKYLSIYLLIHIYLSYFPINCIVNSDYLTWSSVQRMPKERSFTIRWILLKASRSNFMKFWVKLLAPRDHSPPICWMEVLNLLKGDDDQYPAGGEATKGPGRVSEPTGRAYLFFSFYFLYLYIHSFSFILFYLILFIFLFFYSFKYVFIYLFILIYLIFNLCYLFCFYSFLDASSHLYMRPCPSFRWLVRWLVTLSSNTVKNG